MAKDTPAAAPADPVTAGRTARRELEAEVERAQREALPPPVDESAAVRRARLDKSRRDTIARHAAVEDAQRREAQRARRALEALTPAERDATREADRKDHEERQAELEAAVALEGRRLRDEVPAVPAEA